MTKRMGKFIDKRFCVVIRFAAFAFFHCQENKNTGTGKILLRKILQSSAYFIRGFFIVSDDDGVVNAGEIGKLFRLSQPVLLGQSFQLYVGKRGINGRGEGFIKKIHIKVIRKYATAVGKKGDIHKGSVIMSQVVSGKTISTILSDWRGY